MGTTSLTIQPTISPREPVDNGPRSLPPLLKTCGERRTLKLNHNPDRPAGLPAEQDSPGPQNHPNPNPNLSLRRRKSRRKRRKRRRRPHHHLQHQHQHRNQNLKRRRNRRKKILKRRSLTKNKEETIDNQELISRTASEL